MKTAGKRKAADEANPDLLPHPASDVDLKANKHLRYTGALGLEDDDATKVYVLAKGYWRNVRDGELFTADFGNPQYPCSCASSEVHRFLVTCIKGYTKMVCMKCVNSFDKVHDLSKDQVENLGLWFKDIERT